MRVYELAKEINKTNKEVLDALQAHKIEVKSHMSSLESNQITTVKEHFAPKAAPAKEVKPTPAAKAEAKPEKKNITVVYHPQNSSRGIERRRPAADQNRPAQGRPTGNQPKPVQRTEQRSEERPENRGENRGFHRDNRSADNRGGRRDGDRPQNSRDGVLNRDNRGGDSRGVRRDGDRPQGSRDGGFNRDNRGGDNRGFRRDGRGADNRSNNRGGDGNRFQGQNRNGQQSGRPSFGNNGGRGFTPKDKDDDGVKRFDSKKPVKKTGGGFAAEVDPSRKNDKSKKLEKSKKIEKNKREYRERESEDELAKKRLEKARKAAAILEKKNEIKEISVPEKITVRELAEELKIPAAGIIKKMFMDGKMLTLNSELDFETVENIAAEHNCIVTLKEKIDVIEELLKEEDEAEELMKSRPPVVCVMGHVDHGKTSLLDNIRNTKVIDKEAGGITQHIGAYVVKVNDRKITFLDTPGHEAFTEMRMRGAKSTDIAILVVAADDGVMPQTIEAINHAKAAEIEIIVAVNKIDKPGANLDRVKTELAEHGLTCEDWGGTTVLVPVSAKTGEGIDKLLEMILLVADMLELKANPHRAARGLVIEAKLDKGKGPVANVLIQKGTLHVGDNISAGVAYGKVRAMVDEYNRRQKEAGPSTVVEILGLSAVPEAGDTIVAHATDKEARTFAETFVSEKRESLLEDTKIRMSLDDMYEQLQAGNMKELNLIVKADVQGSVEAMNQSLIKLSNEEVLIKVIHSGVGAITESDISLARASSALVIGFNVRPDVTAKSVAEREGVEVRLYSVIYAAIEDIERAMKGMLAPVYEEKIIGHAEIRQIFKASSIGNIGGSYILDGIFTRGCQVRITRGKDQVFEGKLASLKRFKDDVKEVKAGYECGLVFEEFDAIELEDKVEAYIMVEVERK
ncbi:MAG: translation initiation factor IF-2 [Lachnospiraceae bacterium]|nr:translation initiation factor IF-2 [Lachnospiraceae bacterium]MDY5742641.1 translation initiation factor IF-2 [Lachnospiraceae bacterium]